MRRWVPSDSLICGIPCLRAPHVMWPGGPHERQAFGEYGQISRFNEDLLNVVIYGRGTERRKVVPVSKARYWASRLKVPADLSQQLKLAEKFRLNLHYLESHPSGNGPSGPGDRG